MPTASKILAQTNRIFKFFKADASHTPNNKNPPESSDDQETVFRKSVYPWSERAAKTSILSSLSRLVQVERVNR